MTERTFEGFLLTRNWRDTSDGVELEFWFSSPDGPLCIMVSGESSVFFLAECDLPRRDLSQAERGCELKPVHLRTFAMTRCRCLFPQLPPGRRAPIAAGAGLEPLEADINPAERYLMERFITGSALAGEPMRGPVPALRKIRRCRSAITGHPESSVF